MNSMARCAVPHHMRNDYRVKQGLPKQVDVVPPPVHWPPPHHLHPMKNSSSYIDFLSSCLSMSSTGVRKDTSTFANDISQFNTADQSLSSLTSATTNNVSDCFR